MTYHCLICGFYSVNISRASSFTQGLLFRMLACTASYAKALTYSWELSGMCHLHVLVLITLCVWTGGSCGITGVISSLRFLKTSLFKVLKTTFAYTGVIRNVPAQFIVVLSCLPWDQLTITHPDVAGKHFRILSKSTEWFFFSSVSPSSFIISRVNWSWR